MPFFEFRFIIGNVDINVAVRNDAPLVERILVHVAQRDKLVVPLEVRKRESCNPANEPMAWSLAAFNFSAMGSSSERCGTR